MSADGTPPSLDVLLAQCLYDKSLETRRSIPTFARKYVENFLTGMVWFDRRMTKVMITMEMLILHCAEEYTTGFKVDLKQGFQKCSPYREQLIEYLGFSCEPPGCCQVVVAVRVTWWRMLQFWSAYIPCSTQHLDAVQLALEQIDVIRRLVDKYPVYMTLVTTAKEKVGPESRWLLARPKEVVPHPRRRQSKNPESARSKRSSDPLCPIYNTYIALNHYTNDRLVHRRSGVREPLGSNPGAGTRSDLAIQEASRLAGSLAVYPRRRRTQSEAEGLVSPWAMQSIARCATITKQPCVPLVVLSIAKVSRQMLYTTCQISASLYNVTRVANCHVSYEISRILGTKELSRMDKQKTGRRVGFWTFLGGNTIDTVLKKLDSRSHNAVILGSSGHRKWEGGKWHLPQPPPPVTLGCAKYSRGGATRKQCILIFILLRAVALRHFFSQSCTVIALVIPQHDCGCRELSGPGQRVYIVAVDLRFHSLKSGALSILKCQLFELNEGCCVAGVCAGIEQAHEDGLLASLIGVEGGHAIGTSLGVLRMLYQLGARYLTLTHTCNTPW
ncbi:hypothetical protein PR048_002847 [Dryococelus australis]|uniref:Dipeptidase n=1 Tax=Dryococelus australis TaxID=614101 RepID=A0ABQ9ILA3_9NEOP|nr:hypothetical protein PR048_002847 [Dryococelus australis]